MASGRRRDACFVGGEDKNDKSATTNATNTIRVSSSDRAKFISSCVVVDSARHSLFFSFSQARLMDIVRPLVTSEDYVVQKYTKAHPFKAVGRVQASASAATFQPSGAPRKLLNLLNEHLLLLF